MHRREPNSIWLEFPLDSQSPNGVESRRPLDYRGAFLTFDLFWVRLFCLLQDAVHSFQWLIGILQDLTPHCLKQTAIEKSARTRCTSGHVVLIAVRWFFITLHNPLFFLCVTEEVWRRDGRICPWCWALFYAYVMQCLIVEHNTIQLKFLFKSPDELSIKQSFSCFCRSNCLLVQGLSTSMSFLKNRSVKSFSLPNLTQLQNLIQHHWTVVNLIVWYLLSSFKLLDHCALFLW